MLFSINLYRKLKEQLDCNNKLKQKKLQHFTKRQFFKKISTKNYLSNFS